MNTTNLSSRKKRHIRIRQEIQGTASKPRLNVFRSNTKIYAQIIDDVAKVTLVAASTQELAKSKEQKVHNNIENAKQLGAILAKKALEKNIKEVIFDRGGYAYHGKIKAFADACREAGLKF